MNIGMIGLGKMGANMTTRLLRGGHHVVVSDLNEAAVQAAVGRHSTPAKAPRGKDTALRAPSRQAQRPNRSCRPAAGAAAGGDEPSPGATHMNVKNPATRITVVSTVFWCTASPPTHPGAARRPAPERARCHGRMAGWAGF